MFALLTGLTTDGDFVTRQRNVDVNFIRIAMFVIFHSGLNNDTATHEHPKWTNVFS